MAKAAEDHSKGERPTWLVTGGAGFIGGAFVRSVCGAGRAHVINLDLLTYAASLESLASVAKNPHYTFVKGDIGDRDLVLRLLREHRVSGIIHFAAESHVDRSIEGPRAFFSTNVMGTLGLLESARDYWRDLSGAARDSFRFLHVSTDEVFGTLGPDDPPFCETTPYAPNSPYAASKASSDMVVRAFQHTFGLPTLTTNCSNNYGPYQFPEKLIPLMILKAVTGGELPVYGDGKQVRDWLHVDDHVRGILRVLEEGRVGETYAIGGGHEVPNIEIVHEVCRILDGVRPKAGGGTYASQIRFVADRPGHDRRYAINSGKIRADLGWQPKWEFAKGLSQTVAWYLDNGPWWEGIIAARYELKRLGINPEITRASGVGS